MTLAYYILIAYSILVFVGGCIGLLIVGSYISFFTSIFSFIFLQAFTILSKVGYKQASIANVILILGLTSFFAYRYWLTLAVMPGGFMAILSVIALGAAITMLFK